MFRCSVVGLLMSCLCALSIAAEPPAGVQVWSCRRWQTVWAGSVPRANPQMKALRPIELVGTRNAVCSGYVLVTREGAPIKGLKASVGDLAGADGNSRIAAGRIQVRFGELAAPAKSWMPPIRFDRLLEQAPDEVAVFSPAKVRIRGFRSFKPKNPNPVAMMSVWVTVRVPTDAAPGEYKGLLSVEADGLARLAVPVKLKVCGWRMPDPKDFQVRTIGWMNPEALAKHYEVPLWSKRHFDLMGQSMERMLELGSRHVAIDVTKGYPARGNADTMIKWVKQPDGSYRYDFTIFDKYCDLAARKIGKPFPVRLNIWRGPRTRDRESRTFDYVNATVLVLDPANGQTSELTAPTKFGSKEMKAFWKPFLDEARLRLEKRGWFDVTGLGWMSYSWSPNRAMVSMVKSIWPDGKWIDTTHGRTTKYRAAASGVTVPVFVQSTVWNEGSLKAYSTWTTGPYPRHYARKFNPATAFCTHARSQYRESSNPSLWKLHIKHEEALLKGNVGLECVGADHFPGKTVRGRYRRGAWTAYAQGPYQGTMAILGAGKAGPVATERFEAMREGIQLCEAMAFIQKALEAKKLSGDLKARANKVLDDRAKALVACWTAGPNRRSAVWKFSEYAKGAAARDSELYTVAAEVARRVDGQ